MSKSKFPDLLAGMTEGLTGRLLISMPSLDDGPFAQSVVLICQHDETHAFGLILNKPVLGVLARDAVADIRLSPAINAEEAPIFFGGPCDPQRGIVLHSNEFASEDTLAVPPAFGITATREALERLHGDQLRPQTSRLMAGHAGWEAGQLDDELRHNYWLDISATPELVFHTPAESLWETALEQAGLNALDLSALCADSSAGTRPLM
jgi:putative transcriptional regulator